MEPMIDSVVYVIPQAGGLLTEWATLLSTIAATASVIIACAALWLTRKQIHMHEQHNRLMVKPHLDGMTHIDGGECLYRYEITNNGIGPAIITDATVFLDDEQVVADDEVERAMMILMSDMSPPAIGSYIMPGQCVQLITVETDKGYPPTAFRQRIRERTYLIVQYQSIYAQPFTFDSRKA